MMKSYIVALSTTALINVAPFALAASSTDLTVTGTITPSACTPNLSTGGIVDYDKIAAKDLNQTELTYLPEALLQLKVDCQATTPMTFRLIDNNPVHDTAPFMSLGKPPANEPIGSVSFVFSNTVVDTVSVGMSHSKDNGQSWYSTLYLDPHNLLAPSQSGNWSIPIASQNFSTDLTVKGWIYRADQLTLTDEVPLNDNATIQVEYL